MKGIIFTEFLEMVEHHFGLEMADRIIVESQVPSKGHYTSVGTYPYSEMVSLLVVLSKESNLSIDQLLHFYGKYLLKSFTNHYDHFFVNVHSSFDLLSNIEDYIHVEVLKLYPDAQLPRLVVKYKSDNELRIVYQSERKLWALAEGLMEATFEKYNEKATIEKIFLNEEKTEIEFFIKKSV